jgi:hypothetical protein
VRGDIYIEIRRRRGLAIHAANGIHKYKCGIAKAAAPGRHAGLVIGDGRGKQGVRTNWLVAS